MNKCVMTIVVAAAALGCYGITATKEYVDRRDSAISNMVKIVAAEKQDVINDLEMIRSGAAAGATAVQTETDPTIKAWAKADTKPTYTAAEVGAVASYGGTANSLTIGGDSLTANTGINLSEGCSISFAGLTLWSRDSHGSLMLPFLQDEDDTLVCSSDLSRLVDKTEFYEAILGVAKSATNYTDSVASGKLSVHNPAAIVLDAPDLATNKFIVKDGSNSQLFHLGRAGEFELGSYGARITTGSGYEKAYYLTGGATASDNREIAVKGDIPAVPTNIVTYSGTAPQTSAAILSSANAYTDNAISQIPAPSVQSNYLYSANGTYRVNATGELFAASAIVGGYWTDGNGNTFYKVGWDSARTVYEWRSSSLNVPIYYYRNSNPSPMVMYASLFSVACDSRTLDPEVDGTVFPDLVGSGKNCIYHSQQTTFLPDGKPYDRFATTNDLRIAADALAADVESKKLYELSSVITNNATAYIPLASGQSFPAIPIYAGQPNRVRDFVVYCATIDAQTITLPTSVEWHYNQADLSLDAGSFNALYFSEVTDGVFVFSKSVLADSQPAQ